MDFCRNIGVPFNFDVLTRDEFAREAAILGKKVFFRTQSLCEAGR